MITRDYDTVSEAINALTKEGYQEDFTTSEGVFIGSYSKRTYSPNQLTIVETFRFEGITDPQDEATIFAIIAEDGIKGTLIMSYSAEHNYDTTLIQQMNQK